MKFLSIAEIRDIEKEAINNGISALDLMEQAGTEMAKHILENYPKENYPQITIICGKGNNGGDGLVIARKLAQAKYQTNVILLNPEKSLSKETKFQLTQLPKEVNVFNYSNEPDNKVKKLCSILSDSNLLIDAIFGIGFHGKVSGLYADIICACNASGKPIISVDIPSGINGDYGPESEIYIRPTETLTIIAPKISMQIPDPTPEYGNIFVINLKIK